VEQLEIKVIEEEAAIFEQQFLEDLELKRENKIAERKVEFQRNQSLPL
jgi:hypothetical protein